MADELGVAVLRLTIDDSAFRTSLNNAKAQIEKELGGAVSGATAARRPATPPPRPGSLTRPAINPITGMTTAYETAERASAELLQNDLERLQVLRQITQRLQEQAAISQGGFGEASRATFGTQDPVEKSIRRNQEKRARDAARAGRGEQQSAQQRTALEEDLAQITARRVAQQEDAAAIAKQSQADKQRELAVEKQLTKETAKRRNENAKLRKDIAANALIGAGFPLLFGQGVGAAVGGGLGGAAGAGLGGTFGFAGSIVGTALGAAFDATLQKAQTLAQGLQTPISSFDALKEASLLSSKSVEKQAEALIAVGRNAEAAIVIQADLQKTFGDAASAKDYLNAVDDLNRAWSQATTLLGSFVAGPLAKFLEGISKRVQPTPPPDIRAERRRQGALLSDVGFGVTALSLGLAATPFAPAALPGLAVGGSLVSIGAGISAGGDEAKAAEQAAAAAKVEREQAAKINELRKATKKELSDSYKLITATVQGDRAALDLAQEQAIINEKNAALRNLAADGVTSSADARVVAVEQEAAKKLFDLKERQLQKDREITATQYVQTVQTELQLRGIQERITAAQQLAGAEQGVTRETLRGIIAVRQGIEEARRREQNIGAEISAARISGAEPEEIASLVRQQRVAAAETRAKLFEGALALQEAGEKLRKDLTSAVLDFTKVRSEAQGLNRFLSGAQVAQREQQNFQLLLPQFRQAQARFQELTGAQAPEFRGIIQGVNASIRDFIEATNREFESRENLVGVQRSLTEVNQALADINSQLVGATNALAEKEWVVAVNVVNQAGGASTVNAINGLS